MRHIFVTGFIGVGKSTLISQWKRWFDKRGISCAIVEEYISWEPIRGEEMLRASYHADSTMDLQLFIIKCYREQLSHMKNVQYVLWERGPWECLETFFRGSEEDKAKLANHLDDLMREFKIERPIQAFPPHDITDVDPSNFSSVISFFMTNAKQVFKRGTSVYVFLTAIDHQRQLDNIIKRGRPSELAHYKKVEDLFEINMKYIKIFRTYGHSKIIKIVNKIEIDYIDF